MEILSDCSFAWTSASSDRNSDAAEEMIENNHNEEESESGSGYKKKLQNKLFQNERNDSQQQEKHTKKAKKRKLKEEPTDEERPRTKLVKSEPESDIDVHKNKRKKHKSSEYGSIEDSVNSVLLEENYLNMKVKEEQSEVLLANNIKLKKEKREKDFEGIGEEYSLHSYEQQEEYSACENYNKNEDLAHEPPQLKNKVKKKKSSKRKSNDTDGYNGTILIEKFSADETIVETPVKKKKGKSTRKSSRKRSTSDSENSKRYPPTKENSNVQNNDTSQSRCGSQSDKDSISDTFADEDAVLHNKLNQEGITNHDLRSHPECVQRIAKISDRIRFEDEENSEIETTKIRKRHSLKIENFFKLHKNLKPLLYKLEEQTLISKEDEIWVLKCPRDIDINALNGLNLVVDSKCKFKIGSVTYEGSVNTDANGIAILTSERGRPSVKVIQSDAVINIRRRIPKPHFVENSVMINNQTDFIPLPDTKCRHPLFGSDYKRAIKLSQTAKERLKGGQTLKDINLLQAKFERKKKKKLPASDKDETDAASLVKREPHSDTESNAGVKKKKRKRKHSKYEDMPPKEAKKLKQEPPVEVWDSAKAIEENLFNF